MGFVRQAVLCLALSLCLAHGLKQGQGPKAGEEIVRSDKWCGEHHFGAGAAGCVKHSGCSFDERANMCHSSTYHSDDWCMRAGQSDLDTCLQFAGCVFIPEHDDRAAMCASTQEHSDEWCHRHSQTTIEDPIQRCMDLGGCRWEPSAETCLAEEITAMDLLTCTEVDAEEGLTIFANQDLIAHENPEDCVECMKGDRVATTKDGTRWRSDGKQCCEHSEGVIVKFVPECTEEGDYEALQYDDNTEFYFCFDIEGHEIPDSRYKKTSDGKAPAGRPSCEKMRRMNVGMQCPNAMTLNVMGGAVVDQTVKKKFAHPDVGVCDMSCNTDVDCKEDEWCCFNGCGQSCQKPVMPHADCNHIVLDPWLQSKPAGGQKPRILSKDGWTSLEEDMTGEESEYELEALAGVGSWTPGAEYNKDVDHGSAEIVSCAPHWWGDPPRKVHCVHGIWEEFEMTCHKDCQQFVIQGGVEWKNNLQENAELPSWFRERDRNYHIIGKGIHHGSMRHVECIPGYGPIDGLPDVMMLGFEDIECVNGQWHSVLANINDPPLPSRTLVCDVCYDAPPHMWRDESERDCTFYKQRPMKCLEEEAQEARDHCRIACRTCDENRLKYIRRNRIASLEFVKHRNNWKRVNVNKLRMFKENLTGFKRKRIRIVTKVDRKTLKDMQREADVEDGLDEVDRVEAALEE